MNKIVLKKMEWARLSIFFCSLLITSCKSDLATPEMLPLVPTIEVPSLAVISNANYEWGEFSITRKNVSDIIKYDDKGKVIALLTTSDKGDTTTIDLNYKGNKIFLNTAFKDTYELDDKGRVILHTSSEVQHEMTFIHSEKYSYDNAGYLAKIDLAVNDMIYSVITYEVSDGNFQKFSLSNPTNGKVSRSYVFSYNGKKVASSFSMFTAVFANNTFSTVEKYLNFGKQSVDQLSQVNYRLINLDGVIKSGTLKVVMDLNEAHNILKFELIGNQLDGFPSDNLSPLPRKVSFGLK